jgi:hypothetical protein
LGDAVFFFADVGDMALQAGAAGSASTSDTEAFGPVKGSEQTKFRVTSVHTGLSGANPAAYAVCAGRARVQADETNPNALTIVLAPDVDLLRGVPINHFVYRGIRRDSLIGTNGELKAGTTLPDKLLADDPADKSADRLGLAFRSVTPSTVFDRGDDDPIDSLFFETTSLKAIPVQAGDRLGTFDGAGFGFEILVRSPWAAPALELLRKVDVSGAGADRGNVITIPPGASAPRARAIREQVYGYLDPCAFYGMCFDRAVGYVRAGAPSSATDAEQLFDNVLSLFANRHAVYLDIRNDNGLSYNFYDTYGAGDVLVASDTAFLARLQRNNVPIAEAQKTAYATHGWPLKILDGLAFAVPGNADKAGVRLAMYVGEPPEARVRREVFVEFSRLYYTKRKRRRGAPVEPTGKDRLVDVLAKPRTSDGPVRAWTDDVVLGLPVVTVETAPGNNQRAPIAFAVRLRYLRQHEPQPAAAPPRYISTAGPWDNVFTLDVKPSRWKNDDLCHWWLTGHVKRVEPHPDNQQVYDGMVEAGIAVDRDPVTLADARYTFYYVPIYVVPEPSSYHVVSGGNPAGTGGGVGAASSFFQRKEPGTLSDGSCYLSLVKVSEFNSWTPYPIVPVDPAVIAAPADPSGFLNFLTFLENTRPEQADAEPANPFHSKESLHAISFSAAEYDALLGLVTAGGFDRTLHPVFLQVRRRIWPRNDQTATARAYQALELRIAGYDANGFCHSLDVPSTGPGKILPLSLPADGMLFCTDDAARFEPLETTWNETQICTQVRHASMASPSRDSEHENDVLYFARAIADLKRNHPAFYAAMQNLQLEGAAVILHDHPGLDQVRRRRYRIEVTFDDTMKYVKGAPDNDASGLTETHFYSGLFPGTGQANPSWYGVRVTGLTTIANVPTPAGVIAADRYGYGDLATQPKTRRLNESRYIDLNRDRTLTSSQVNEKFLADYTRAKIDANLFDKDKLYLESSWEPSGAGVRPYARITLAELKALGGGTRDFNQPVTIRINRPQVAAELEQEPTTKVYSPRRLLVSVTLCHELGHADFTIREPLVDLVWLRLEEVFDAEVGVNAIVANAGPKGDLATWRLLPQTAYPNPVNPNPLNVPISKDFETEDVKRKQSDPSASDRNAQLRADFFHAKTGGGHLRGSPGGAWSCGVQLVVVEKMYAEVNRRIEAWATARGLPGGTIAHGFGYCFLNYDRANLNPNNQ